MICATTRLHHVMAGAFLILVVLPGRAALGTPLFSVKDLGLASPSLLSNDTSAEGWLSYNDVIAQNRLKVDASGNVTQRPWLTGSPEDSPGASSPLVPSVIQNSSSPGGTILSRAGESVVGWGLVDHGAWQGFAAIDGQAVTVGPLPGTPWSQALGINLAGQVVGISAGVPFLFTIPSGIAAIPTPGNAPGIAYSVNDAGIVVGQYQTTGGGVVHGHAFVSNNGAPGVDLNRLIDPSSGWNVTTAMDINKFGQIATYGMGTDGKSHMLLLNPIGPLDLSKLTDPQPDPSTPPGSVPTDPVPVPEPATLTIFSLLAAGLGGRRIARGRS